MTEEAQAKALALRSALNDTWDISHHKRLTLAIAHDAQRGFHRGKGVVGYLRACIRQRRHQCGFAGVWEAYKSDIGQQFQFEDDGHLLHRLSRLCIARSLIRGRTELEVTQSATPAFEQQYLLAVVGDVADIFARLGIIDDGTTRHVDIDVLAIGAMTLILTAVAAMLSKDMALVFQMEQCPVVMVAAQIDAAALATVATIRASVGVILHVA